MIFPIGDDNIKGGPKPYFSYGLIVVNVGIFLLQVVTPGNLYCEFAAIPGEIMEGRKLYTTVTNMFLHGGWMHLLGNMLFLWIFGDNIESTVGNVKFILFYLLGGFIASMAHIVLGNIGETATAACCKVCEVADCQNPCGAWVPSLGASGAIAAVMGAYLVMYPKSRIKMIFLVFFSTFYIPAFLFLIFWFGQQLFFGFGSMVPGAGEAAGTAWWAHIGGFVVGLAFGLLWRGKAHRPDSTPSGPDYV